MDPEMAQFVLKNAGEVIRSLEWRYDGETRKYWCPSCGHTKKSGHTRWCKLAGTLTSIGILAPAAAPASR